MDNTVDNKNTNDTTMPAGAEGDNLPVSGGAALPVDASGGNGGQKTLRTDVGGKRVAVSRLSGVLKACVLAGTNKLQQAVTNEKMTIDDTWIITIEDYIHSVENIVKHPKTFIKDDRELIAMERARNSDRESVRHLSTHSEHVRTIERDGTVVPKKVLVKQRMEDYAIYENRVTLTLIKNLKLFIEERYTAIKALIKYYEVTDLTLESKFDFGRAKIEYDLNMKISQRLDSADKCQELLERLERIRKRVQIMENSSFARELKNAKLVKPPLARTNLLVKNVDYRNVYNLWLFISSFKEVGYKVEVTNKITPFDDVYTSDLTALVAESIRVMIRNNTINKDQYKGVQFKQRKPKKFLMIKKVKPKLEKPQSEMLPTDKGINQYYYDKIKQLFDRDLKEGNKKAKAKASAKGTVQEESQTIDSVFKRFAKSLTRINVTVLDEIVKKTSKEKANNKTQKLGTPFDGARIKIKEEEENEKSYEALIKLKQEELEMLKKRRQAAAGRIEKRTKELEQKIIKAQQAAERKERERQKALERKEQEKQKALARKLAQKQREEEKKAKEKQRAEEKREREKAKAAEQKEKEKAAEEKLKGKLQKEEKQQKAAGAKPKDKPQKEKEQQKTAEDLKPRQSQNTQEDAETAIDISDS